MYFINLKLGFYMIDPGWFLLVALAVKRVDLYEMFDKEPNGVLQWGRAKELYGSS